MKISALVFLCAVGCQGFSRADEEAISAASGAWQDATIRRDFKTLAELYAEDAVLLPPGLPPVRGRAAIRKHFEAFPKLDALNNRTVELEGRGDLAYVRGEFVMTIGGQQDKGHYVEIWRRQDDGSWKLWRDTYASETAHE